MSRLYGALEAGGTKMVMGVADETGRILHSASCATRTPDETLPDIISYFKAHDIAALGLASFGPCDVNPASPTYGTILNTPKPGWGQFPFRQVLMDALGVPVICENDVNAAALAEGRVGNAKGLHNFLYLTIGTGIGGGMYCEGNLVHGMLHPEWGHVLLAPRADDPTPDGFCPFHKHCAEGLAAGPALEKRWGMPGKELPDDHIAFDLEAYYLAQLCVCAIMSCMPERILLGGGVMQRGDMLPRIRRYVLEMQNGYIDTPQLRDIDTYIQSPALYPVSGLVGAALLALDAR